MPPQTGRTLLHIAIALLIIAPLPLFKYLYDPGVQFAVDTSIIAMYDAQAATGKIAIENSRETGSVIFFSYDQEQAAKENSEVERRKRFVSFKMAGDSQRGPSHLKVIKQAGHYLVFVPVLKGTENDDETSFLMTNLANNLSQKVFDDRPVDIHLSDAFFNSLKVIPSNSPQN